MGARQSLVSVVVPCYNYEGYLAQCLDSVLSQKWVRFEVIVVDDASTDGSLDVANRYATTDERVRVLHHELNAGHIATYNEGLAAANGDYLVLLSADDMLTPGSLARAAALLNAHPDVGLAYGGALRFTGQTPPSPRSGTPRWRIWPGEDWIRLRARRGHNVVVCPEAVVRASVFHTVGPYREDLPHSADFAMWIAVASRSNVGYIRNCDQAFYRVHGKNMHLERFSTSADQGQLRELEHRTLAFEAALENVDDQGLLYTARQTMARQAIELAVAAYDRDQTRSKSVEAYLAFAQATCPDIASQRIWRSIQRRERGGPHALYPALATVRHLLRDIEGRVRWRRWRFYGT
jgi:glycosyltransferase involved in cell wall biosynthesis